MSLRPILAVVAATLTMAPAAALECRLALSLAVDVSASVDGKEHLLQREGIARALEHPDIAAAVFATPGTTIALHIFEWSGRWNQAVLLDWTLIESPAHLRSLAMPLREKRRSASEFPTSLGSAMLFAHTQMRRAPPCDAQTVDVSGDGRNNDGFGPDSAYKAADYSRITVNGLAIDGEDISLTDYFAREVIRGPGAFVMSTQDYSGFEEAIRRKMEREIRPHSVATLQDNALPTP